MILNASQLEALRQCNDAILREEEPLPEYSAITIRDLLQTVDTLKKEKKKWQRTAQERGQALESIRGVVQKLHLGGEAE